MGFFDSIFGQRKKVCNAELPAMLNTMVFSQHDNLLDALRRIITEGGYTPSDQLPEELFHILLMNAYDAIQCIEGTDYDNVWKLITDDLCRKALPEFCRRTYGEFLNDRCVEINQRGVERIHRYRKLDKTEGTPGLKEAEFLASVFTQEGVVADIRVITNIWACIQISRKCFQDELVSKYRFAV